MPSNDSPKSADRAETKADGLSNAPRVGGHPVPAGPDEARDARREVYRDRERRRAVAALDRYLEVVYGQGVADFSRVTAAAGDRFIEAVIAAVLAVLVIPTVERCPECGAGPFALAENLAGHRGEAHAATPTGEVGLHQKAHYGVPDSVVPDE